MWSLFFTCPFILVCMCVYKCFKNLKMFSYDRKYIKMQKKTLVFLTFICFQMYVSYIGHLSLSLSLSLSLWENKIQKILKCPFTHVCRLIAILFFCCMYAVCVWECVLPVSISFKEFVGNCNKMLIFSAVVVVT